MQPENYSHLKRALNSAGKTAAQESIVEAGVAVLISELCLLSHNIHKLHMISANEMII